ncbi:hypothetical protein ACFSVJ_30685 [Prauserella oleivorans]
MANLLLGVVPMDAPMPAVDGIRATEHLVSTSVGPRGSSPSRRSRRTPSTRCCGRARAVSAETLVAAVRTVAAGSRCWSRP